MEFQIYARHKRGNAMTRSRLLSSMGTLTVVLVVLHITAACHSPPDDRVTVPTSEPRIGCSPVEGPRSSKDAERAIEQAKGAITSIYEKRSRSGEGSPADIARFEPYRATLKDGVWHVEGTIPAAYHGFIPIISVCRNDEGAAVEWVVP